MKILIPIFDLIADETAILFTGTIARSTNASIQLFHIAPKKMEKQASRDYGKTLLDRVAELLPDIPVEMKVRRGNANKKMLSEAREGNYDLLIVPSWQLYRHFHSLPLAASRSQDIPCCVIIVRNPRAELRRVLICSGGMEVSNTVIETGAKLAGALGADVTLLHVVSFVPSMYTGLQHIEEPIDEILKSGTPISRHLHHAAEILKEYGIHADIKIRRGSTTAEIVRELDIEEYDLVVIGASGGAGWVSGWFMGNLTKDVISSVGIPVMVVNQARSAKGAQFQ